MKSGIYLIILNHSLFCIELNRENSILPSGFVYVIDEGHNFVKSVREQLTIKLHKITTHHKVLAASLIRECFNNSLKSKISRICGGIRG